MPYLPDGSFARGEQWFAKRGRPKNHTEVQWVEGFLGMKRKWEQWNFVGNLENVQA